MMIKEFIGKILTGERDGTTLWKIPICEIEYQPVTDPAEGVLIASLAENILRCGLLQPILLYRDKHNPLMPRSYRLISGRRRLEAVRMLGRTHIDGIVVRCKPEQIMALSLSDNLLCREPDVLRLASQIQCLLDGGMSFDRLSTLLSISEDQLRSLVDLLSWAPEDLRLFQLSGASRGDLDRFVGLQPLERRMMLERLCDGSADSPRFSDGRTECNSMIAERVEKVSLCDTRLFVNSIERAVELMRKSGYDASIERSDDDLICSFTIRVSKLPGVTASNCATHNVSRETLSNSAVRPRFSTAASIFEAIAEDEMTFAENVSRETFSVKENEENEEKLELCIDGC